MIELFIMTILGMNVSDTEDVIPFPVEQDGVTFCYNKDNDIECNYVQMPENKIRQLQEHLEEWVDEKK